MYLFGFPQGLAGGSKETEYTTNYSTSHETLSNTNLGGSYNSTSWGTSSITTGSTTKTKNLWKIQKGLIYEANVNELEIWANGFVALRYRKWNRDWNYTNHYVINGEEYLEQAGNSANMPTIFYYKFTAPSEIDVVQSNLGRTFTSYVGTYTVGAWQRNYKAGNAPHTVNVKCYAFSQNSYVMQNFSSNPHWSNAIVSASTSSVTSGFNTSFNTTKNTSSSLHQTSYTTDYQTTRITYG